MGPTVYFPSEGKRAEDFFALKNPTASARFEPANLGTKGQHATPRPPKSLKVVLVGEQLRISMLSGARTSPHFHLHHFINLLKVCFIYYLYKDAVRRFRRWGPLVAKAGTL
jgi:hypothetical protein